jgi:hypothetical protein
VASRRKSVHQRDMERMRTKYEAGDKTALAMAIAICGRRRKPLPPWAADSWWDGWIDVMKRVADWNNLLGKVKVRTSKQLRRERTQIDQLRKIAKLLPSVGDLPIQRDNDTGMIAALAEKMGNTPRQTKELYYQLSPLVRRRRSRDPRQSQ